MGQGLLGVVRSIGSSLGVTVTSVFFERRRIAHQLAAYDLYNADTVAHRETLSGVQQYLYQAGLDDSLTGPAALRAIRRQMDIEAIAAGFQESFILIGGFFLFASIPMWFLLVRHLQTGGWSHRPQDERGGLVAVDNHQQKERHT